MAEKKYILGMELDQLRRDKEKAKSLFSDLGRDVERTGKQIDGTFLSIGKVVAGLGAGFAFEEMARQLYNFSQQFNKSMLEVSTISQTVTNDMDGFKEKILELTTEVPIGADEAAKALYQIVSAGHDGAAGMNVLEVAAKAAVGGVTETATAADAITSLLNAYKLSADEAETVSDKLFTTVRLGKTDWDQLGTKIAGVAPLAANFGIEMEQVLAAVATLTASGTPTAEAVTQIRASIVAASKVLGDGAFQTRTLQEGLAEIAEMAGGSESKLKALVPEIEAMNGVLGMTGLNAQKASEHLAEFGNIDGASQSAFVKTLEDANLQLTLLKNNALATFSGLGDGVMASAGSIAKYINEAFDSGALERYSKAVIVLVSAFGIYKGAVIAATVVQKLQKQVMVEMIYQKKLAATQSIILSNAEALAAARTSLLTAAKFRLVTALKAVKVAMLQNPWTAALVGITAVVTAVIVFNDGIDSTTKKLKKQREALDETKEAMQGVADEMAQYDKKSKGAKSMADRYDELKTKVNLSKSELEELNSIVSTLSGAYPDAITKVNQYGDAVEISTGKVLRQIEAERERIRLMNADTLNDAAENAGDAYENYIKYKGKAKDNRATAKSYTSSSEYQNNPFARNKLQPTVISLNKDALKNEAAAKESLEALYNYVYELERGGDTLAQAVARINEESNLNLSVDWVEDVKKSIEAAAEAEATLTDKGKKTGVPTTSSESEEEQKERLKKQKELEELRLKYIEDAANQEIALERSRIDDKYQLLSFDYEQTLAAIKKQEDAYLAAGGTDTSAFVTMRKVANEQYLDDLDKYFSDVRAKDKEAFDNRIQLEKETLEKVLQQTATYEQKRKAIIEKQQAEIAALYNGGEFDAQTGDIVGGTLKDGVVQGNVENLVNAYKISLQDLDVETAKTLGSLGELWGDFANVAGKEIDKVIAKNEALYDLLSSGTSFSADIGKEYGITEEMYEGLKDVDNLSDFRNRLDELTETSREAKSNFDGLGAAWSQMIAGAKSGDLEGFQAGLDGVSSKILAGVDLANELAEALETIGDATGNTEWNKVADGIGQVTEAFEMLTSVISETVETAQKGASFGMYGMIAGAIVGLAKSVASIFKGRKEAREAAAKEAQDFARSEYLAQYEINQLYRDRYDWAKKIGETELKNSERNIQESQSQLTATKQEQDELLEKLQGEEYVENVEYEHGTWFRKAKTTTTMGSLEGKSYDEILELEAAGKLTDEAQAYLDALRASKEEGEDLAQTLEDAQETLREAVVGMGFNEVVNHAMDSLLDGTITAGEAFDEIMQGAASNMLKEMMNQDVRDWYEGFAAAGEDGYTEDEKDYWKKKWEAMQASNAQRKNEVEDITGVDFQEAERTSTAKGIATASQESVDENNGRLTAIQGHTFSIAENVLRMRELAEISAGAIQPSIIIGGGGGSDTASTIGEDIKYLRTNAGKILTTVMGIKDDTAHLSRLQKIETDMGSVKTSLNNIEIKGIKIKK